MEIEKGCRICRNKICQDKYQDINVCEVTGQRVSMLSKSEWTEYLKRWENAVGIELMNAKKMFKGNRTKKIEMEVKRLREEMQSIEARPSGKVVENCPHFKQHDAILPVYTRSVGRN